MTKTVEYVLERVFNAPREMVWRAWTDPNLLHRWYGPGAETIIHKFDLEVGGEWLNEMKWGENSMFQKVVFQEVDAPRKMVWHHYASTDENWNPKPHPMMPDWPQVLLTTVTFEDRGEETLVHLSQIPIDATDVQIASFAEKMSGMDKGWGSGYTILDKVLLEIA